MTELRIESGHMPFRNTQGGYTLDKGKGNRAFAQHVNFTKVFAHVPKVIVFLSMFDIGNAEDTRIKVRPINVTAYGFDIEVSTWLSTKAYGCGTSWIAYDKTFASKNGARLDDGFARFNKDTGGYHLHVGKGDRHYTFHTNFDKAFPSIPHVVAFFSGLDILKDEDQRVKVVPTNVDVNGFDLDVSTWSTTRVWSISVVWLAMEHIPNDGARIEAGHLPFKKTTAGFTLHHKKMGNRTFANHVNYNKKFTGPNMPHIVTGLSMIDIAKEDDYRVSVTTGNVNKDGFDLSLNTWSRTLIYGAGA